MNFSTDTIALIKNSLSITAIISEYVPTLKQSGKNMMGLCPFHNEKRPSFSVSEDYRMYKCFSCGESGDIIQFIEKIEGISFQEALTLLAKRSGIVLEKGIKNYNSSHKDSLLQFNLRCVKLFTIFLSRTEGGDAKRYVQERKIPREIAEKFSLGYSPREFGRLENLLKSKGFTEDFLLQTGFFSKNEKGFTKTLFFDRLMFPIYNYLGECVGFGGRALRDGVMPKYINSPETELYKKSKELYGINFAKDSMRELGYGFLVEGYMDVIACHCHGITNVAAPCGTAVTKEQIKLFARYCKEVILLLDGDEAGARGAMKALKESANIEGLRVSVINLPKGMDPDDYLKKHGIDEFNLIVNNRVSAFEFCVKYAMKEVDRKDHFSMMNVFKYIFDYIIVWENELVREVLLENLADKLSFRKEYIKEEFEKIKNRGARAAEESKNIVEKKDVSLENSILKSNYFYIELDLIILLHLYENSKDLLIASDFNESFLSEQIREIYILAKNNDFNMNLFLEYIDSGTILDYVTTRLLDENYNNTQEKTVKLGIIDLITDIKRRHYKARNDELTEQIYYCQNYNDYEHITILQEEKEALALNIMNLTSLQELKK